MQRNSVISSLLLLELDASTTADVFRCWLAEYAIGIYVISVIEYADDTEVGVTVIASGEQSKLLLTVYVDTLGCEGVWFIISVFNEVRADYCFNSKAGTEDVCLVRSGDGNLDWVILTAATACPLSNSRKYIARLGWSDRAGLGTLVPAVVAVGEAIAEQQSVDAFQCVGTASHLLFRVAVVSFGFSVVDAIVDIVEETLRINLGSLLDPVLDISEFPFDPSEAHRRRGETGLEQGSEPTGDGRLFVGGGHRGDCEKNDG